MTDKLYLFTTHNTQLLHTPTCYHAFHLVLSHSTVYHTLYLLLTAPGSSVQSSHYSLLSLLLCYSFLSLSLPCVSSITTIHSAWLELSHHSSVHLHWWWVAASLYHAPCVLPCSCLSYHVSPSPQIWRIRERVFDPFTPRHIIPWTLDIVKQNAKVFCFFSGQAKRSQVRLISQCFEAAIVDMCAFLFCGLFWWASCFLTFQNLVRLFSLELNSSFSTMNIIRWSKDTC